MSTIQTRSAEEATDLLFGTVLPSLEISDEAFISTQYEELQKDWGSAALHTGTKEELYNRVLSNMKRSSHEFGFHYFLVARKRANGPAREGEILSWSDENAISVCLWRTSDKIYLCGNYYFK